MQKEELNSWQSIAKDYIAGEQRPAHTHLRAQLLYACEGVMLASTPQGKRVIAPFQALWIPAGVEHTITFLSSTKMRSLYFERNEYAGLLDSNQIKVFAATALIRELISTLFKQQFPTAKAEMRHLLLLLARECQSFEADILLPEKEPLRSLLNDMLKHRAWSRSAQTMAEKLNVTPRTFSRHFLRDTGMNFRDWKHRMRLIFALEQIANGVSVKAAALSAGYSSPSTLCAEFKKLYSSCPTDFLQSVGGE